MQAIQTLEEFYAHALAIEREAAHAYREFQQYFAERDDPVLAGLCGTLARLEQDHFERLLRDCERLALPAIDAGAWRWLEGGPPETLAREFLYRIAQPRQLLELALEAEHRARSFFEWVAGTAPDERLAATAREMAREENEHVGWVVSALEYLPEAQADWSRLIENGAVPSLALGADRRSGGVR